MIFQLLLNGFTTVKRMESVSKETRFTTISKRPTPLRSASDSATWKKSKRKALPFSGNTSRIKKSWDGQVSYVITRVVLESRLFMSTAAMWSYTGDGPVTIGMVVTQLSFTRIALRSSYFCLGSKLDLLFLGSFDPPVCFGGLGVNFL